MCACSFYDIWRDFVYTHVGLQCAISHHEFRSPTARFEAGKNEHSPISYNLFYYVTGLYERNRVYGAKCQ